MSQINLTLMAAIGITGGISTGKTSFCECLREIVPGAKFFDADQATHQLGSSANDFSITSCNCRRSAALTRLKRNCLGALIAGNWVSAKSQTKLTHLVFFMVSCSA
jgi:dephospho-CoA kinase